MDALGTTSVSVRPGTAGKVAFNTCSNGLQREDVCGRPVRNQMAAVREESCSVTSGSHAPDAVRLASSNRAAGQRVKSWRGRVDGWVATGHRRSRKQPKDTMGGDVTSEGVQEE